MNENPFIPDELWMYRRLIHKANVAELRAGDGRVVYTEGLPGLTAYLNRHLFIWSDDRMCFVRASPGVGPARPGRQADH